MTDPVLRRFVTAHLLTVVAEWGTTIAMLVYAHAWGGTSALGVVSLCLLAPSIVGAPVAASAIVRLGAQTVRLIGFGVQAVSFGVAAVLASADAPAPVVAVFAVVGVGAISVLRPSGAVVLPAIVRSAKGLTSVNLAVSYCESASALVGPLIAAGFIAMSGPWLMFAVCAVGSAASMGLTAWRATRIPRPIAQRPQGVLRAAFRELRTRPWGVGVVGVASARNVVVGAFDILLVVAAVEALDLGDGGPGLLSALVGGGAMLSVVATTVVVRRRRLTPALLFALASTAVGCAVLGLRLETPVAVAVLPVVGICLSSMDNLSRILLQRSTDPGSLGPMFVTLGLVTGAGQMLGAGVAQLMVGLTDLRTAFVVVGALMLGLMVLTQSSLRTADDHADVPVVEMSLLVGLPMFAPLPTAGLEAVARAAEEVTVAAGTDLIRQGDDGDVFYVVSHGSFDVEMSGEHIRVARRGDFFGEVALLANVPRTATVRAVEDSEVLAIPRQPFLVAVVGHDAALATASDHVRGLRLDMDRTIEIITSVDADRDDR